jgi:hypothetical protein
MTHSVSSVCVIPPISPMPSQNNDLKRAGYFSTHKIFNGEAFVMMIKTSLLDLVISIDVIACHRYRAIPERTHAGGK